MSLIPTRIDPRSARFQANREGMLARLAEIEGLLAQSRAGGGVKYVERHRARGKMLARERVELLLDRDAPFLELSPLAAVVLLPLYPHYSKTTTGSSVNEWQRGLRARNVGGIEARVVREYPDHPLYIRALASNISRALPRVPAADRGRVHLVFSSHGTPVKLVKAGDPYRHHIVRTYEAVTAAGNWGLPHHLCFQSKVGPEKWLEPSLDETIDRLAAAKVSHMLVVPIAFVSDHIETLSEINIEGKHRAKALGVRWFDMSPAINTHPDFIRCLADLVRKAAA